MQHYTSVEDYFASQSEDVKPGLEQMRKAIKGVVPGAEEVISYGMPAFKQDGIVVWYAATKKHFGLYPKSAVIKAFSEKLQPYNVSKGTIRFPIDQPLPLKLIKEIVKFRAEENKILAGAKKLAKQTATRR